MQMSTILLVFSALNEFFILSYPHQKSSNDSLVVGLKGKPFFKKVSGVL